MHGAYSVKRKNFIHYGSSLIALELLMVNTLKYTQHITVGRYFLTKKEIFCSSNGFGRCKL
jgi:hypothetical protein